MDVVSLQTNNISLSLYRGAVKAFPVDALILYTTSYMLNKQHHGSDYYYYLNRLKIMSSACRTSLCE